MCANAGQEDLYTRLAESARAGKRVVRLVPGDPLLFGVADGEVLALAKAGVAFEIVPGIPEASASATAAGIPIPSGMFAGDSATNFISPVAVLGQNRELNFPATTGGVAIDLSVGELAAMAHRLMAAKWPMRTPVALIAHGATSRQTVITSTLGEITGRLADANLPSRLILVIGDAVRRREALMWFERLPLFGKRIIATRAAHQASVFSDGLRQRGAEPIELPTIELRDPESFEPMDRAIAQLEQYHWVLFTSANGVERFFARVDAAGRDARAIRGQVCAIGPATAVELKRFGVRTDRTAAEYRAEGVLAALAGEDLSGKRILIPRAAIARDVLPRELEAQGARVDVAEAYRTVAAEIPQATLANLLETPPDLITFTSSSTASNCPPELRVIPAASIGPVTTETAKRLGFNVVVEAKQFTIDGLLEALEEHFASKRL